MELVILFSLASSFFNASEVVMGKKYMDETGRNEHVFWRVIFTALLLVPIAMITTGIESFHITGIGLVYTLITGIITAAAMIAYAIAMEEMDISLLNIITKISLFIVLVSEVTLGRDKLTINLTIGLILCLAGLFSFSKLKSLQSTKKAWIFALITALAWGIKPTIQKTCFDQNLVSKEMMLFLNSIITAFIVYIRYKPNIKLTKDTFKKYSLISSLKLGSNLTNLYAMTLGSVTISSIIGNASIFWVTIFSFFMFGDKITKEKIIGTILFFAGMIIAVL